MANQDHLEVLKHGCYVKFTAQPGQRDALVEHQLRAAAGVSKVAECELYLINTSPTELESVWVTEVWRNQQDLDASLTTRILRRLLNKSSRF